MFIWNKDRTFCIKLDIITCFAIEKNKDSYEVLCFTSDESPIHMGFFDKELEAREAINNILDNVIMGGSINV